MFKAILAGVVLSLGSSLGLAVQGHWDAQLEMKLELDRAEYNLDDKIDLKIEFRNRGATAVYLYKKFTWGEGGSLEYRLFDEQGNRVKRFVIIDDALLEVLKEPDKSRLILLEPGDSETYTDWLPVFDLVRAPGAYQLEIGYFPIAPWREHNGIPVLGRDASPLVGRTEFKVVEPPRDQRN